MFFMFVRQHVKVVAHAVEVRSFLQNCLTKALHASFPERLRSEENVRWLALFRRFAVAPLESNSPR